MYQNLTDLLHHFILFMEELHFDVSADWQWLGKLEEHVLVLAPRVSRVRRVDLHFQLVHHKLGICKKVVVVVGSRRVSAVRRKR